MLNTKYIIINPNAAPVVNNYACGNAWFVNNLVFADNADEELSELEKINIRKTAVADSRFSNLLQGKNYRNDTPGSIKLVDYTPNKLTYKSDASADKIAIFSEIYYDKGWIASIDGEEVDHFRADYTLRALFIPEGEHTIVFEFRPKSYYMGEKISYAGSLLYFCNVSWG